MKATVEALENLSKKYNASFHRLTQGYKKFGQKKIGFEFIYPSKKGIGDNGLWMEFHGSVRSYPLSLVEDVLKKAIEKFTEEVADKSNRSYLFLVSNEIELMIDNHDENFHVKREEFYQRYARKTVA